MADPTDHEALLEQERYRKRKLSNDVAEGLVIPIEQLSDALQKSARLVVAILESLPLLVKRHWPEVKGDHIFSMKQVICERRNTIADTPWHRE